MKISEYLSAECVTVQLKSVEKENIIRELANLVFAAYPEIDTDEAISSLFDREQLMSTGIGQGVAIPHARIKSASDVRMGFALLKEGADFDSLDGKRVHFVFLIFFPEENVNMQLRVLAKVSRILQRSGLNEQLIQAETAEEIISVIKNYEETKSY